MLLNGVFAVVWNCWKFAVVEMLWICVGFVCVLRVSLMFCDSDVGVYSSVEKL